MALADQFAACPGVFYRTLAQDGNLMRIRVSGGGLSSTQARSLADLAQRYSEKNAEKNAQLTITNRANLQLRTSTPLTETDLAQLQTLKLAAAQPEFDHLRNILINPTAGLDPTEHYNVRPLAQTLETAILSQPDLAALPGKFSIGLDGGGAFPISDRPNDLRWLINPAQPSPQFRLLLSGPDGLLDTGLEVPPMALTEVTLAIARWYLTQVQAQPTSERRRYRFKQAIATLGEEGGRRREDGGGRTEDWRAALRGLHVPLEPPLGCYEQRSGRRDDPQVFLGLGVFLGQLRVEQLRALADLSDRAGDGSLRLTPWQSLILPSIAADQAEDVMAEVKALDFELERSWRALAIACTGQPGCASAHTPSQADARALVKTLSDRALPPAVLHVSGCTKSCAHHGPSDWTLVGTTSAEGTPVYDCYPGLSPQANRDETLGEKQNDNQGDSTPPDLPIQGVPIQAIATTLLSHRGLNPQVCDAKASHGEDFER